MEVNDSIATVNGAFYFRNNSDREGYFPLAFPFYIDDFCDYPHYIEVYLLDNDIKVPLDFSRIGDTDKIRFGILLDPHQEIIWHLEYKQKIKSGRAVYILKSTAAWGESLEWATYKFIVPPNFSKLEIWPAPDTSYTEDSNTIYTCKKTNFMPEQDMEIKWEVVK